MVKCVYNSIFIYNEHFGMFKWSHIRGHFTLGACLKLCYPECTVMFSVCGHHLMSLRILPHLLLMVMLRGGMLSSILTL